MPSSPSSGDLMWRTFQESFLAKLNSADYNRVLSQKLINQRTAGDMTSLQYNQGQGKKLNATTQRLFNESALHDNVLNFNNRTSNRKSKSNTYHSPSSPPPPPSPPSPTFGEGSAAIDADPSFFMTALDKNHEHDESDIDEICYSDSETHHAHKRKRKLFLTDFKPTIPESYEDAHNGKKSVLRQSIQTALNSTNREKNMPLPKQFYSLQTLLERLQGSREEQKIFFQQVEAIIRSKGTQHAVNLVKRNVEFCESDHYMMENKMRRLEERGEEKTDKIGAAKTRVNFLQEQKLNKITSKIKAREAVVLNKRNLIINEARKTDWLVLVKLAAQHSKSSVKFKEARKNAAGSEKEKLLAQKIIGMWTTKKAPEKGQLYRDCVKKVSEERLAMNPAK